MMLMPLPPFDAAIRYDISSPRLFFADVFLRADERFSAVTRRHATRLMRRAHFTAPYFSSSRCFTADKKLAATHAVRHLRRLKIDTPISPPQLLRLMPQSSACAMVRAQRLSALPLLRRAKCFCCQRRCRAQKAQRSGAAARQRALRCAKNT